MATDISAHYSRGDLLGRLRAALLDDGVDPDHLTMETLAPDRVRFGAMPITRHEALKPVRLLPMQTLLTFTPDFSDEGTGAQFYAEGWLLAHHHIFGGARSGEIGAVDA